ncbi:hypothetical protein SAMN05428976_106112 [Clostridium sp. USBA 49]|nr:MULTISPECIES: hypothetical protein [Clostridium]SKA84053.1 hypothetical protein SAMN05428976_106112 [Clostridium sp. USBA 49]
MFSDISIAVIFSGLVRMRYSDMISVPVPISIILELIVVKAPAPVK